MLALYLSSCATQKSKDEVDINFELLETECLANANYEESEKYYAILVKQIPQEAQYWFRFVNIYASTKRVDAAVFYYREVLVRDPEFNKAWHNMGLVQLR